MPALDWLNREDAFRIAARVPTCVMRPHGEAPGTVGDATTAQASLLVQGDNLDALAALLPFYRGRVKCIFIATRRTTPGAHRGASKPASRSASSWAPPVRCRRTSAT
jgi:adenine-specific DNA-methyltransferase